MRSYNIYSRYILTGTSATKCPWFVAYHSVLKYKDRLYSISSSKCSLYLRTEWYLFFSWLDRGCYGGNVRRGCVKKPDAIRLCSEMESSNCRRRCRRRSWAVLTEQTLSFSCARTCAHVPTLLAPLYKFAAQVKKELDAVMSNSFGFGGTNVSLLFSRV